MAERMTAEREKEIREMVATEYSDHSNYAILLVELDAVREELGEKEGERDAWKDNAEQWARERDTARKALSDVEKTGSALAMLLHPEMGMPMPTRDELVATIQGMNRTCRDALQTP